MSVTSNLLHRLLDFALPPVCLGCRRIEPGGRLGLGLCSPCRRLLELVRPGCRTCGRSLAAPQGREGPLCGSCLQAPPSYDRLLAGWSYRPPFDQVIRGLKFGRLDFLGPELARELATRFLPSLAAVDLVVPVPLHWRRLMIRGYNQAAEIARPLARRVGSPVASVLSRRRSTRPQARLPRARRASNVQGCFEVRHRARLGGRRIVLVDDVATTGSTLNAAARALKEAGAAEVLALVAGRTPDEWIEPATGGFDTPSPGSL